MKHFKKIMLLILVIFMTSFITHEAYAQTLVPLYRDGVAIKHRGTNNPVMTPNIFVEKEEEFRGTWVATVYNLNMPKHTSETQYKTAYEALIARVKAKNLNAILFQTRPLNDAFYESNYAPFSRYLTGTEGVSPGWDVMEYMVSYAHSQGVQFHAWMNPYRVANSSLPKQDYLNTLHASNFARQNPNYVIAGNKSGENFPYILDPGRPEVKQYIKNVVVEIMQKYDIDGIHFDDYFYPYSGMADAEDQATYDAYNAFDLSRADWRRRNVDDAVETVKAAVDLHNQTNNTNVKFGISPFGIWRNKGTDPLGSNTAGLESYDTQYADSRNWVKKNWVHYITPQIYWTFNNQPAAPYADVTDWWADVVTGTNVDLIVGHSITSSSHLADEMVAQTNYNQKYPQIKGSIFYSAAALESQVMNTLKADNWKNVAVNPFDTFEKGLIAQYKDTLLKNNFRTTDNLNLITTMGRHNITWTSSHPNIISNTGVVTRPSGADQVVTLTATDQGNRQKKFTVIVAKSDTPAPPLPPTHEIIGELQDGTENVYTDEITIKLTSSQNYTIKYFYTDGVNTTGELTYTGPITFKKRGGFVFNVFTLDPNGVKSSTEQFNFRIDIPFDESYNKVIRGGVPVKFNETGQDIILPNYREKQSEVRAVWVSTVANIDVPKYQNDEQYKAYLIDILDTVKALNMNTVFFQVRSMNDAFYPSTLAPYSEYIKGVKGEGLDWDILAFMVEQAHIRGIELHAWLNPYRVMNDRPGTKEEKIAMLHPDNFARKNPDLVMEDNNGAMILNPGEPRVRQYIYDVIQELMNNYNIDGIHMDDYFYTYGGHSDSHDQDAFDNYNPNNLNRADWRRSNIDTLVREIFELVETHNTTHDVKIKWGISPIGIWDSVENDPRGSYSGKYSASSYRHQFADTRKWVKEGWLHYINPQVYWEFSRTVAPYADLVKWWNDVAEGTGVKVVVGQGFYRMLEDGSMDHEDEMVDQIRFNQSYPNVIGTAFFSYKTLKSDRSVVTNTLLRFKETYWTKQVPWAWESKVFPPDTEDIIEAKQTLATKIVDYRALVDTLKITNTTNLYRLNLDELYILQTDLDKINEAFNQAQETIDTLGLTIQQVNHAITLLDGAYTRLEGKILTGLGEEFTPEKIEMINRLNALIEELKSLRVRYPGTDKPKEELPETQFVPKEVSESTLAFITRAVVLLDQDLISNTDLSAYQIEGLSVKSTFEASIFTGTNEGNVASLKESIQTLISAFETKMNLYEVTSESNPNNLSKGQTFIRTSTLLKVTRLIREAQNYIEESHTQEELEAYFTKLETDIDAIEAELIIGTQEAQMMDTDTIMLIVVSVLAILMIGTISIIAVKKRKKA